MRNKGGKPRRWRGGRLRRGVLAAGLLAAASAGPGCLYYGNYPDEESLTWWNARESAGLLELMEQSLAYVIEQDVQTQPGLAIPPEGEPLLAVNLPGSISPESYRRVAERAYPRVVPLSERRNDLPVYHIGAVRIRGGSARVHVLRPITGLERDVTDAPLAGVQLWFEGRSGDWDLVEVRPREVGTLTVSRIVPIEALERAIEADQRGGTPDEETVETEPEQGAEDEAAAGPAQAPDGDAQTDTDTGAG